MSEYALTHKNLWSTELWCGLSLRNIPKIKNLNFYKIIQNVVFRVMKTCSLVSGYQRFRRNCCLHLHARHYLKVENIHSFETLLTACNTVPSQNWKITVLTLTTVKTSHLLEQNLWCHKMFFFNGNKLFGKFRI
jgi:hypothetical protein